MLHLVEKFIMKRDSFLLQYIMREIRGRSRNINLRKINKRFEVFLMPIGDKQKRIVGLVSELLGVEPVRPPENLLYNVLSSSKHKEYYKLLFDFLLLLKGDKELHLSKPLRLLSCDAYFGHPWNFVFEFDEIQHFSSYRKVLLLQYPLLNFGFSPSYYINLCNQYCDMADRYRKSKTAYEFPFPTGRTRQRAFFDALRDIMPFVEGAMLNPTIRIDEFSVAEIINNEMSFKHEKKKIASLLLERFALAKMQNRVRRFKKSL
jgi:hypothetical protein